jgi:AraC-like DNA-binding protein
MHLRRIDNYLLRTPRHAIDATWGGRHDLAIRYLANPATSAGQVGFVLGFSEPSAFHRAFRRWTGKAPSAFRLAQSG